MNQKTELLYKEETYKIRGACFSVYNSLGGGIKEKIIERALAKELKDQNLKIKLQEKINVIYKGENIGIYIPDITVEEKIIIELKSKPFITKEDEKQFWGYLKGSEFKLGLLINFAPNKLYIKRFIYTNKK